MSWGTLTAKSHAEYSANVIGGYDQSLGYADGLGGSSNIIDHGFATSQFNVGVGLAFTLEQMSGEL